MLAETLVQLLDGRSQTVTFAESCTGGLLCAEITAVPGASAVFERGLVVYSDAAKQSELGVAASVFVEHGAVSRACVEAMAVGLSAGGATYGAAISGVAGPSGGSVSKPVGTVWFGWFGPAGVYSGARVLKGDRSAVRQQSVDVCLEALLSLVRREVPAWVHGPG
jgi:nicotinamide-nucleotide amidase